VYWDRIRRKHGAFVTRQLGAFGSDLSAVAGFFDELWTKPALGLRDPAKAWILNGAGFALRAVGRLREATEPLMAALDSHIEQNDWVESANDASNLSQLYLALGEIKQAVDYAERNLEYADRSGAWGEILLVRTTLADVLRQAGDTKRATELFHEAEEMQKQQQPEYPYLYSVQGFRFCDLLLSQGLYREVKKRASRTLEWGTRQKILLDIASNNLSLGVAYLLEAQEEETGDFTQAADYVNQAVEGLRKAGVQDSIVPGLFARAGLYRQQGDYDRARGDLAEAAEVAERGEMRLHLADYHLESARLCLTEGKHSQAREHYEEAAKRVEEMGYHRRDPEVLLIEAELQIVEGNKEAGEATLKKAKGRIDEMGCRRWDIEVQRLNSKVNE
jgi:tetratricopeptide (TPR) repeat protein